MSGQIDRDVFCRACGYNLRGLSGDPICCPECGTGNSLSEIDIPAAVIRRALLRLESSAAYTAFAITMLVLIATVLLPAAVRIGSGLECLAFAAAMALAIPVSTYLFARSCDQQPGWKSAFAGYVLLSVGKASTLLLLVFGGFAWIGGTPNGQEAAWRGRVVIALALILLAIGLTMGRRAYARVRQKMAALQRRAAVAIAKRELELCTRQGPANPD